jgi:hypothetical protein
VPGEDCSITFTFKATNVSEEGAAYQMAMAAEPYLPRRMILEEILKVDNAEAVMQEMLMEQAEREFPELALPKMIRAFEIAGKEDEAALLKARLENPPEEVPDGPPKPLPPQERVMPPPAQNPMPPMVTAPAPTTKGK